MQRRFRLGLALPALCWEMPPQAQDLENQKHFRLGLPNWLCSWAPSHPAQVLFLGEQPSPRVLWKEMGENVFMSISEVSDLHGGEALEMRSSVTRVKRDK